MHFLVLLAAALVGAIVVVVLAICGLVAVGRRRGRSRQSRLRGTAFLMGAVAVALYVWGMLHVAGAVLEAEDGGTDSSPLRPCREAGIEVAYHVDGYDVGYLPLRFDCQVDGRTAYTTSTVPGYVNPATALLGLLAVTFGVLAARSTGVRRPPGTRLSDREA